MLILTFIFCFTLIGGNNKIFADLLVVQGIPLDQELHNSGTDYGYHHDMYNLGKIMTTESELTIKSDADIRLEIISDGSSTEHTHDLTANEEQKVTVTADSTPFLVTPRDGSTVNIEYSFAGTVKELPIYNKGDDPTAFINEWKNSNASFGLIRGDRFQLYLPVAGLSKIENMSELEYGFQDIPQMIHFYDDELFPLYNKLINVSENKNRFFLKADKDNDAGAYYARYWTADSSATGEMWLQNTWSVKHEIGHGYQSNLIKQMDMGEVSNNVFANYYDYHYHYGQEADEKSWMFSYGNREEVEKNLHQKLDSGSKFSDLGSQGKLILLYFMMDKLGEDGIAQLNTAARQPDLGQIYTTTTEKLYNYISKIGHDKGFDYNYIMQKYGFEENKESYLYKNSVADSSALTSVYDLVPQNQIDTVISALLSADDKRLSKTNFNLVTPQEMTVTGLKSDVQVTLKGAIPENLIGKDIILMDGNKEISKTTITGKQFSFENIPLGIYHVKLKDTESHLSVLNPYVSSNLKGDISELTVQESEASKLLMISNFQFKGLWDDRFMTFDIYPSNLELGVNTLALDANFYAENPHSHFPGEEYSKLIIKQNENILLDKTILGDDTNLFHTVNNIDSVKNNDILIEADHAEGGKRMVITDIIGNSIADESTENMKNQYKLTSSGLNLVNQPVDTERIKKIITVFGDIFLQNSAPVKGTNLALDLYMAIKELPSDEQSQYLEKYSSVFDY